MKEIGIVIPALNERRSVCDIIKGCCAITANVVLVDDGSTDGTADIAESLGCRVIRHDRNRGKGAALKTGFGWMLAQQCRAVVTLDANGQHDPAEIPALIGAYERLKESSGDDILVLGSRSVDRKRMPLSRAMPNRFGSTGRDSRR